ncbi:hypothetical protein [Pseudooceanicola nitratireducens]|uniref:hypothetical protein n=1 Tax=Pseudooceanicola nitratireducens TaxID=517719 RepID=UPI003C7DDE79
MKFDQSVWDDSDPDYAPGLKRNKARGTYFWAPPKKYKDAGYSIKTVRLDEPTDIARAARCRELTREMLDWYRGQETGRREGSWSYLIARYLSDEYSGIWDVRAGTRAQYKKELAKVEAVLGEVDILDTDFTMLMTVKKAMETKGRSTHYIKKWFTHFGLVVSHGVKIRQPGCDEVKAIRSEMRIKTPPRRTRFITREHVEKIVAEADRRGWWQLSVSVLIRFEYLLRGVDVHGEWSPVEDGAGGITHNGLQWDGGLTWEMVDPDLQHFEKVISKTRDSLPEPYLFHLIPEIKKRLANVPKEKRVGPVIAMEDGLPPRNGRLTKQFKTVAKAAELPEYLQIRDARSGGITEAKSMVDGYALRDAAQHTQITTTDIYARGRSETANNVVQIRQNARK